ncbi:MAG: hypothetical protein GX625_00075 [Clostridiaceae bacterium]|nr:hypothetical protein [Clostridiaceae bacterium]
MTDKEIIDYCFKQKNKDKQIRKIAAELGLSSPYVCLVLQNYNNGKIIILNELTRCESLPLPKVPCKSLAFNKGFFFSHSLAAEIKKRARVNHLTL